MLPRLRSLVRNLLRRDLAEERLDEELRTTLDLLIDEKMQTGLAPGEARRAARLELGSIDSLKEQVRDVRAAAMLDRLFRDMRHAARVLSKNRAASLVVVLTFAIGSGAVTATFALVNGILLQPLPFHEPERLVTVKHSAAGLGLPQVNLSSGTYFHYRAHAAAFESLAIYRESKLNLSSSDGRTERIEVCLTNPELFTTLRVHPVAGRLFNDEDGRPGFMNMTWEIPVLVSQRFLDQRYGGNTGLVGQTIVLNGRRRRVIGVLPASFEFPRRETDVWMLFVPSERRADFGTGFDYAAVGRLRPGLTAGQAAAELQRILPSIAGVYADATPQRLAELKLVPIVVSLKEELTGSLRGFLLLLLGGTLLLLAVAASNVATMAALRAEQRAVDTAVRTALGARKGDLVRLLVAEAAALAAAGGMFGLLLARLALALIVRDLPVSVPRISEVRFDAPVAAFAAALAVLGMVVFVAAAAIGRPSLTTTATTLIASNRMTDRRARVRIRRVLLAVQIALALTLLGASALMVSSFWRLSRVDAGFDPVGLLTVEIGLPSRKASQHQQIYDGLVQRLAALGGVHSAAAVSSLPLDGTASSFPFAVGAPVRVTEQPIAVKFVTSGYFDVMRTAVLEGRRLTPGEPLPPDGVLVSDTFARRRLRGHAIGSQIVRREADGRQVEIFDPRSNSPATVPPWVVVGVVADTREGSLREGPAEIVYVPVRDPAVERSLVPTAMVLVLRTSGSVTTLPETVRRAIREFDASLSTARVRAMDEIVAQSIAQERFLCILLVVSAAIALVLGAIGVYGVAAESARRREQEIAIRASLGAHPRQIMAMLLRDSAAFVILGTVLGVASALAAARLIAAFLFEVAPTDAGTLVTATAIVVAVAIVAQLVPARNAIKLDPGAILRRGY